MDMDNHSQDQQLLLDLRSKLKMLAYLSMEVRRLQKIYWDGGRRDFDLRASKAAEKKLDDYHQVLRRQGWGDPPPTSKQSSLL